MTREVRITDVPDILAIYAPIVKNSHWSFELEVPSVGEFQQRISSISERYPYIVMEKDGRVIGYAYASRLRNRAAYGPSVETSIYMHPDVHGQGLGRNLYGKLFSILELSGYSNMYAGATLPNPGSATFHEKMGFQKVGVWPNAGYKFHKWWDVGWWHRSLSPVNIDPMAIVAFADLRRSDAFHKLFD